MAISYPPYHHHTHNHNAFTCISNLLIPIMILFLIIMINPAKSTPTAFIYVGCSQTKYTPNTPYATNLNTLLTTILTSSSTIPFNKYSTLSPNTLNALYQCTPNLTPTDCTNCISHSITQLLNLCSYSSGAAIQLDGCYLRYDNTSFLGVEDKTVVIKRCGMGDGGMGVEEVLEELAEGGGGMYRVGKKGNVRGVAMCSGDLSREECGDCTGEGIERLREECGGKDWGDMFLGKCYVRYSVGGASGGHGDSGGDRGSNSGSGQDEEMEKTLAIIIGLIAGVALLIVFVSFLKKSCEGKDGK